LVFGGNMKKYFIFKPMPVILGCIGFILSFLCNVINKYAFLSHNNYKCALLVIMNSIIWYLFGVRIERYKELSYKDSLTGLFNRRYFSELLDIELKRARRYDSSISLLFIDIDDFKTVNDTYGHKYGDIVLVKFAKILKAEIRETDIVSRWGGEEFVILLHEKDLNASGAVAERLRKTVENQSFKPPITISIGVAVTDGNTSLEEIVCLADSALYKAKERKNKVVVFNPNNAANSCS